MTRRSKPLPATIPANRSSRADTNGMFDFWRPQAKRVALDPKTGAVVQG
ncbi:hypothetical protein [Amycolatopsis sp. NPDC051128]